MALRVQKYGGSSVATVERIVAVAERVARAREHGDDVVVVVSAMGSTTDELIRLATEVTSDPDPRELDTLLSTGELVSSTLLAMALRERNQPAVSLNGLLPPKGPSGASSRVLSAGGWVPSGHEGGWGHPKPIPHAGRPSAGFGALAAPDRGSRPGPRRA